jgi:hypothetical protein
LRRPEQVPVRRPACHATLQRQQRLVRAARVVR